MGRTFRSTVLRLRKARSMPASRLWLRPAPARRRWAGGLDARAEDVDPIEGGLARDGRLVARGADARVGDLEREVLADLAPPEHLADLERDAGLAAERPLRARGGGHDLGQLAFGRRQELPTLAGPLLGQEGVLTDDEPLAGVVRMGDLGQVLLIKERQLQGPARGQGP